MPVLFSRIVNFQEEKIIIIIIKWGKKKVVWMIMMKFEPFSVKDQFV